MSTSGKSDSSNLGKIGRKYKIEENVKSSYLAVFREFHCDQSRLNSCLAILSVFQRIIIHSMGVNKVA